MSESSEKIKELETQLSHLKEILNNVGAHIYTKDSDGKYTFANKMVCDLFQLPIDKIIGRTDEDFFDLEKSKELRAYDLTVLQEGQTIQKTETNYVKSRNETRSYWVAKSPLYDQEGNVVGLCGISTDITEKLETEIKLVQTNQILESILNNTTTSIFVKDKDLKWRYINPSCTEMLGFNPDDVIGKKDDELFPSDIAKNLTKIDLKVLKGKKIEVEETVIDRSGNKRIIWSTKVPLINNQNIEGLLGIGYDMSDLLSLKKQLEEQNTELKNLLEQRSLFVDAIVHELRIPIGFIKTTSNILKKEVGEKQIEMLNLIHDSSSDILGLINNLLDISKIESNDFIHHKKQINYLSLVEQVVEIDKHFANKKGITLEKIIDVSKQIVYVDPSKIIQVLNNLLSNAIKYSYINSKIEVKVFKDKNNNNIITQVIDYGQGIRPEDIDVIFQYFKKSNAVPTNEENAYGLGLSIAKKIAEEYNGTITVESKVGKGSTFTFTLPINKTE